MTKRTVVNDSDDSDDAASSPEQASIKYSQQLKTQATSNLKKRNPSAQASTIQTIENGGSIPFSLESEGSPSQRSSVLAYYAGARDSNAPIPGENANDAFKYTAANDETPKLEGMISSSMAMIHRAYEPCNKRNVTTFANQHHLGELSQWNGGFLELKVKQAQTDHAEMTGWNLRGSMMEKFLNHDPTIMFPSVPTASTMPYHTLTQQKLLNQALADFAAGKSPSHIEAQAVMSSNTSGMNWSDFIKSQVMEAPSPAELDQGPLEIVKASDSAEPEMMLYSHALQSDLGGKPGNPYASFQAQVVESLSPTSEILSSVAPTHSRVDTVGAPSDVHSVSTSQVPGIYNQDYQEKFPKVENIRATELSERTHQVAENDLSSQGKTSERTVRCGVVRTPLCDITASAGVVATRNSTSFPQRKRRKGSASTTTLVNPSSYQDKAAQQPREDSECSFAPNLGNSIPKVDEDTICLDYVKAALSTSNRLLLESCEPKHLSGPSVVVETASWLSPSTMIEGVANTPTNIASIDRLDATARARTSKLANVAPMASENIETSNGGKLSREGVSQTVQPYSADVAGETNSEVREKANSTNSPADEFNVPAVTLQVDDDLEEAHRDKPMSASCESPTEKIRKGNHMNEAKLLRKISPAPPNASLEGSDEECETTQSRQAAGRITESLGTVPRSQMPEQELSKVFQGPQASSRASTKSQSIMIDPTCHKTSAPLSGPVQLRKTSYRVGLSKKARIPSLLSMVKK